MKNVILVCIDSLRRDRLAQYGYPFDYMPECRKFLGDGYALNAVTPSTWTPTVFSSIFSGLYPWEHKVLRDMILHPSEIYTAESKCLMLFKAHYRMMITGNPWMHSQYGVVKDFHEVVYTQDSWDGGKIFEALSGNINKLKRVPRFLLFLHYMDVHTPYDTALSTLIDSRTLKELHGDSPIRSIDPQKNERTLLEENVAYNSSILKMDRYLAQAFALLDDAGVLNKSAIVFFGDHGEELRDHGRVLYPRHGHSLYNEMIFVPCIIKTDRPLDISKDEYIELKDVLNILKSSMKGESLKGYARERLYSYVEELATIGSVFDVKKKKKCIVNFTRQTTELYDWELDWAEKYDLSSIESPLEWESDVHQRMAVTRQNTKEEVNKAGLKAIAFYLPQFHPIPENDQWWGEGFTEWTNVKKAKPLFEGHWQPRIPADLGYYDLRDPQVRRKQARLAKAHGLHGFCYYYYWFNGKKLLDLPLREVLESGEPDFPFCLCYANENWTRAWDGQEQDILIKQEHSPENDLRFIHDIIPILQDPRYIRVNNKPLLLVYRAQLFPDPQKTAQLWREAVKNAGLEDLYLCKCEAFGDYVPPEELGFDANVEFHPHGVREIPRLHYYENQIKISQPGFSAVIFDYETAANVLMSRQWPDYRLFRAVMLGWDNTARRHEGAFIFHHFSPGAYEEWLAFVSKLTVQQYPQEERIVFINAWNEWAEGTYLEPDQKYGLRCLEATKRAIESAEVFRHKDVRIGNLETQIRKLAEVLRYREARIGDLETATADKDEELMRLREELMRLREGVAWLQETIKVKDSEIDRLKMSEQKVNKELENILSSESWRITKPLRSISSVFRRALSR